MALKFESNDPIILAGLLFSVMFLNDPNLPINTASASCIFSTVSFLRLVPDLTANSKPASEFSRSAIMILLSINQSSNKRADFITSLPAPSPGITRIFFSGTLLIK